MDADDFLVKRQRDFEALDNDEAEEIDQPNDENDIIGDADDLDRADAVARAAPGGVHGLDSKVAIRDQKWVDLVRVAPFARANPPSVLKGTLGGQQSVFSGGPFIQVANWGGDDAETLPVTVTLCAVEQPNFNGPKGAVQPVRAVGIVKFGTRGFLVKAEVDIGTGVQFTISGSMVTVQVGLESFIASEQTNTPAVAQLSGMLSFWSVLRTAPLTRTKYVDHVVGAGGDTSPLIERPPFAADVVVYRESGTNPNTIPAMAVQLLDSNGVVVVEVDVAAGVSLLDPIRLPDDVYFLRIQNNDLVSNISVIKAVFGLSI